MQKFFTLAVFKQDICKLFDIFCYMPRLNAEKSFKEKSEKKNIDDATFL